MAKKKYYAVARGHKPGIYEEWYGENGAESQINAFPDALYKSFSECNEAEEWLKHPTIPKRKTKSPPPPKTESRELTATSQPPTADRVIIYTDGGCLGNPGPGGYGIVLLYGTHRKELSGSAPQTTNNRMEMTACIEALNALKRRCAVTLYSDSSYIVNGVTKGWAKRWRANNWMRNKTEAAENADLWEQLLELCEKHDVSFVWVKGHAGNPENERCDQLAKQAAGKFCG
jgi:ribonuclease HI